MEPWDQREGEAPESYTRFLIFRNLGPGRTLLLAAIEYRALRPTNAKKRHSTQRYVPGHWGDDAKKNEWHERAVAWDIAQLTKQGDELCRYWVGILVSAARKAAIKLTDPRCNPKDFAQCITVIEKLSPYLTPDVLKSLQPAATSPEPEQVGSDTLPLRRAACE